MKSEGLSVIFISHKLGEVLSVADEMTVIRRGTTVGTAVPAETTPRQLAEMMVGSELPTPETAESTVTDRPVITVDQLRLAAPGGKALLDHISFTIHAGEVLGIAGVEGNGQTELVDALIGLKHADSGTITLVEEEITAWPTRRRREQGIGYIPEDRHRHGLLLEAPLWENRILGHVTEKPLAKGVWLDPKAAQEDTRRIVTAYDVRTPGIDVTAASLSGGNQQKLIVGREMSHKPRFLIAAHPTRGVDVGAQAAIWDHIREARREGLAVLLISADLDELIGLSDTLRVIYNGRLVADADPATITPEELGSAMTGAATGHLEHEEYPRDLEGRRPRVSGRRGPLMKKFDKERVLLAVAGPVIALAVAFVLIAIVLVASGKNPIEPFALMFEQLGFSDIQVLIINQASMYYIAALAVAIGFRMNLFNIGVDGQYQLAAMMAAVVGAHVSMPAAIQVPLLLLTAVLTGAFWAGIAGVLKVTRGVSEVVATIMLNAIATSVIAYLWLPDVFGVKVGNNNTTGEMHESGWIPGIGMGAAGEIYGLVLLAVLLGIGYWVVLNRTRFGFDLRASGASSTAAAASGVDPKRMVLTAMLLSGGLAGLAGLPILLGDTHTYSLNFPTGIGFLGIGIALLGRNSPVGIAFAALLWAWLDKASPELDFHGYDKEIAVIMQGLIVLSVVVSYEAVREWGLRRQQRRVGAELAAGHVLGTHNTTKEVAGR
ncbi:Vitamin B12 import ATP-binding protein BtuD [Streptomyces purpurascens]